MADLAEQLPLPAERPAVRAHGVIPWLRANLFNSVFNTILTLVAVYFLAVTIPPLIRWAFIDAVWNAPNGQACRGPGGQEVGACWAFIGEKLRFILFGRFPYTEQWRPLLVVVLPHALRVIIPPMTSEYLSLTKNSSLAVIIGYPDLVSIANTTINQTGQAVEGIAMIMAVYLAISLAISALMNLYNRAVALVER